MIKLKATNAALAKTLQNPYAHAGVAAWLRGYAYACEYSSRSAVFAQLAASCAHFGEQFERTQILPSAANCEKDAAVLILAAELEAVGFFKLACEQSNAAGAGAGTGESEIISAEIADLFYRLWAHSVSFSQPALRELIAPAASEDALSDLIKHIINKE